MKVTWEQFHVRTAHPFRISRGVKTGDDLVWVRLEHEGIEGWGEADPSTYYGETADTVEAALRRLAPRIEEIEDPFALESIERDLAGLLGHNGSARCAVSSALHDWVGKRVGLPLWRLWGLDPAEAPLSSFTIGIDDPDVMAQKTRAAEAWPILKIKLGSEDDEARLAAVRAAAPGKILRVDANAAWTPREAVEGIAMCAEYGVEFVEQPLPPSENDELAFVRSRAALPIVVDESSIVARDIPALDGVVDGINIKLAKCGGPREAIRMVHAARACGLSVMLGCMLETSLGIAPAAHLAPLVDYADLDGAALLRSDPFTGPCVEAGRIALTDRPGLGVERVGAGASL
ncbi:dipeptide epimerase [Candidatus Palauibacter sp.]|uniref:dipeptide epimerase n=1 Tax=Candidatus Palauibacter sp. TaxID=3101350 RepID=UPI003B5B2F76